MIVNPSGKLFSGASIENNGRLVLRHTKNDNLSTTFSYTRRFRSRCRKKFASAE